MRRVLFLYNPISGQRHETRLQNVNLAADVFRRAGVDVVLEATTGPGTTSHQARAAAAAGMDAVIVCGGDGSVHEALQGLVNSRTALGVLPLGTGNALANDLGLPRPPRRGAEMLLTAKPQLLHLPKIDFANPVSGVGDRSRYFMIGAGMGADAQLTYRLALAFKQRWGMAAYYTEAWRQWLTYGYPMFEVEFRDGDRLRRELVSQVLAIRVEWMGGFLRRLAPGASLYRDDLRLVLMKSRSRWSYVRYVVGVQFDRAWTRSDIELVYATEFTCRPAEGSPRIFAEADGELLSTLPVSVAMTQATVNLLMPQKALGFRR